MKQKIILMLLLAVAMTAHGQTMSLKECISRGITNNLSLVNARIDMRKGHTGVSQNRARLLPMLDGAFQFTDYLKRPVNVTTGTLLGNDFPDDPTWQTIRSMQYNIAAGLQLNMPLYNQSIYAAIDVARTVEKISTLSYDKAVEDLTMQIGKVYYLAQSSLEQARLTGENISRMEELCAITEAMYEQGVVLEVDLDRAKINLQNLKAQQGQFTTLYAQQINMLRFLLDISPETPVDVEIMSGDIELAATSGISNNLPELRLASMQKELADRRIRAVRAGYIPTLSLTGYAGGLAYQERFSHFFHTSESSRNWFGNCFIGFNITIPIFDANSKKLQIRQHRYDWEKIENSTRLLHDRINREYSDTQLQLDHNIDVYRTQSRNYRQAQEVYDVTAEQFREGVASMTAILQDEMQLRTAQAACVQAHCSFNLARLDLLRLSGNLKLLTE